MEEVPTLLKKTEQKRSVKLCHPSVDFFEFNLVRYARIKRLLVHMVSNGQRLTKKQPLSDIQKRAAKELTSLDSTYKRLINPHIYKVSISERLKKLKKDLVKKALG